MMRHNKSENIGEALRRFLRQEGLETPLNEHRLVDAWPQVMGVGISRYTGDMFVKGGVLYVRILSPALRADLMMSRKVLVAKLNAYVGAQVIEDIVLR